MFYGVYSYSSRNLFLFHEPILNFLSWFLDVLSDVLDFFDGIGNFFRKLKYRIVGKKSQYETYTPRPTTSKQTSFNKPSYTPKPESTSEKKVTRSTSDLCKEADSCVNSDPSRAFSLYEEAAKRGNEHAQYACAEMYYDGKGCKHDTAKALYWYEKSAEQGNVNAQVKCGAFYIMGGGCSTNYAKGTYWYSKAAENGNAEAQYLYAVFLFSGVFCE